MLFCTPCNAQPRRHKFNVIALYENGGHHVEYSKVAKAWLTQLGADRGFTIDFIQNTDAIDSTFLSKYNLFIQLDYPPYGWKPKAAAAFQDYIVNGRGGWIGFHHATLLGGFDGFPMWQWFSGFMGDITYKNYIPNFASATVNVQDSNHPVMQGLPKSFMVKQEEWYSYNQSPRPNVRVLAGVNEKTYSPDSDVKMGADHPVIWTNESVKARNVYIFMGHSPVLFDDATYRKLVTNAIFWAAKPCTENIAFKKKYFYCLAIIEKRTIQATVPKQITKQELKAFVKDRDFTKSLRFISRYTKVSFGKIMNYNYNYASVEDFELDKKVWLAWYENNKCKDLK